MRSQRRRTAGPRPWPSLPTTSGDRAAEVGLADRQRRLGLGADAPQAGDVEVGQGAGQVVDRGQEEMLDSAGRRLDRGRAEWRLALGREDHAVGPGRLGAAQEGADVLGILERVEDEDERRLAPLDRPGQDVGHGWRIGAAATTRATPWWPSKPVRAVSEPPSTSTIGMRRLVAWRTSFSSASRRCGHDEQPAGLTPGDERLLDRSAAGHDLVAGLDQACLRRLQAGPGVGGRAAGVRPAAIRERPVGAIAATALAEWAVGPVPERALLRPASPGEGWPVALRPRGSLEAGSRGVEAGRRSFVARAFLTAWSVVSRRARVRAGRPAIAAFGPAAEPEPGSVRARPVEARPIEARPVALRRALPRSVKARPVSGRAVVSWAVISWPVVPRTVEPGPLKRRSVGGSVEIAPFDRSIRRPIIRPARDAQIRSEAAASGSARSLAAWALAA